MSWWFLYHKLVQHLYFQKSFFPNKMIVLNNKVMRLDQLPVEIRFKLNLNRLLIDFLIWFQPSDLSSRRFRFEFVFRFRFYIEKVRFYSKKFNYIKNWSNLIKNDNLYQKWRPKMTIFDQIRSIFVQIKKFSIN